MCKKMTFKHSLTSSTLHFINGEVIRFSGMCLCPAGHYFAVLWGANGAFTPGPWQLLLVSQSWLLVPYFPFSKSYSNLRRVLIQEEETQRRLLDSGPCSTASTAAKNLHQRAVPVITPAWAVCQYYHPALGVYRIYSIIYTNVTEKYSEDYLISKTTEDLREQALVVAKVFTGISVDSVANKTSDQTEIILLGFQHPALRGEWW